MSTFDQVDDDELQNLLDDELNESDRELVEDNARFSARLRYFAAMLILISIGAVVYWMTRE